MAGKAAVVVTLRLSAQLGCTVRCRGELSPNCACGPYGGTGVAPRVYIGRQCAKVRQMTYQPNGFTLRKCVPVRSHVKGRKRGKTDV